ncbi:MAG: ImmA/IrrE family metallo-endopeptidase, partial [Actinobacteria bacterium]|nr:ImmA/IrrE family metallo-endopeptidase [Actinomycetota bacterium]
MGEEFELDPSVFGHRLRHLRAARAITLKELGDVVGRQPAFLSQLENGKREANLSLINALARALKVTPAELLDTSPPSRRAELEIALERVQLEPLYRGLGLQILKPSARLPTGALEHIVRLADELKRRAHVRAQTPEEARKGNAALRREMRKRDNYFDYIEEVAANALDQVDYPGTGAVSRRILDDLAAYFGFTVRTASDLPQSLRSLTDLRGKTIYIRTRDESGPQVGRSVVFQTLGHFALGHEDPRDFGEFLRQRVEANYFAGAMLLPERAVAPFLAEARRDGDLAIEDLEERFYVSYEMAAHRFTNLATHHLGIPVHFVRSDEEGIIWKAYENDGLPLPADPDGAIEGQRLCRHWGAREAFRETGSFSMHYQYTDTPAGTYWLATYLEAERERKHAITVGTSYDHARFFRGSDTHRRARSGCPDGPCCRRPPATLAARWDGYAWPSPRPHSHVLAAMPAGTFPGVD